VSEAVEQWLEVADLEETTRDRYEDLIRLYIAPRLGVMQVGRLDVELLEMLCGFIPREAEKVIDVAIIS
jgi:integrase